MTLNEHDSDADHRQVPALLGTLLLKRLTDLSARDDRRELRIATQVLDRVQQIQQLEVAPDWRSFTDAILGPAMRKTAAVTSNVEKLPSEHAYEQLDVASKELLAALPALHEIILMASAESVSVVVNAAHELETQLIETRDQVTRESESLSKLLALMADDTLASSYAHQAAAEQSRADRWRGAAVILLTLAVALAAFTVFISISSGLALDHLIGRVGLSGALAGLGAYLQHQASLHRTREEYARSAELKLRTVGPYSAILPPEDAARVRSELASKLFGSESPELNAKGSRT